MFLFIFYFLMGTFTCYYICFKEFWFIWLFFVNPCLPIFAVTNFKSLKEMLFKWANWIFYVYFNFFSLFFLYTLQCFCQFVCKLTYKNMLDKLIARQKTYYWWISFQEGTYWKRPNFQILYKKFTSSIVQHFLLSSWN